MYTLLECYAVEFFHPPKSSENRPTYKSFVVQFEFHSADQASTDTNYPFPWRIFRQNSVPLVQWQIQEIEAKEEKAIQQKETIVEVTPKFDITEFKLDDPRSDDSDDFSSSKGRNDDVN